jgi:hypothetical protein
MEKLTRYPTRIGNGLTKALEVLYNDHSMLVLAKFARFPTIILYGGSYRRIPGKISDSRDNGLCQHVKACSTECCALQAALRWTVEASSTYSDCAVSTVRSLYSFHHLTVLVFRKLIVTIDKCTIFSTSFKLEFAQWKACV